MCKAVHAVWVQNDVRYMLVSAHALTTYTGPNGQPNGHCIKVAIMTQSSRLFIFMQAALKEHMYEADGIHPSARGLEAIAIRLQPFLQHC